MSFDAPVAAARRALEEAGLLREDAGLLCAVSGGSDSVALLHALCRLRAEAGFRLEACHVQHGSEARPRWRTSASCARCARR